MIVYIYNIGVDLYNGFNGLRHRINWTYFTVLDGLAHPLYSLKGLTEWFKSQNNDSDGKLRKVIRLSKMFCKSRKSWKNMPSGLLQTVLCDEKLQQSYERIDELFYYTMQ